MCGTQDVVFLSKHSGTFLDIKNDGGFGFVFADEGTEPFGMMETRSREQENEENVNKTIIIYNPKSVKGYTFSSLTLLI